MNKLMHRASLALCFYVVTSSTHPFKECILSLERSVPYTEETTYQPVEQQTHVAVYAEDQVAYFAAKGESTHMSSGEIPFGDNQLLFYGLCTPDETTTSYFQTNLPKKISGLKLTSQKDYTPELSNTMFDLMIECYKNNPAIDPCDIASQDVLISFLHLIENKAQVYVLHCVEGKFTRVNDDEHIKLEQTDHRSHLCITMPTTSFAPHEPSPVYKLLAKNQLSRSVMLQRPQELVKQLMQTDTNEHIRGMTLFDINAWLARCNHPTTTQVYQSLKTKWDECIPHSVIVVTNTLEQEVLEHYDDSAEDFALFAAKFKDEHASEHSLSAYAAFLDDMLERKKDAEANSISTQLKILWTSLLNCCGRR